MQLASAFSHSVDIKEALQSMASKINERLKPSFIVCFYTEGYDEQKLSSGLSNTFPGVPVHGCSSCQGIMTDEGFHESPAIALLALEDSASSAYGTAIRALDTEVEHTNEEITIESIRAIENAMKDADRKGELPSLILLHASIGLEETIIKAIKDKFGFHLPLVGGTAADNGGFESCSFLTEKGAAQCGLSVSVFYPSMSIATYFSTGYSSTTCSGIATKARGRVLYSIDHKPALTVYRQWIREYTNCQQMGRYLFDKTMSYPLGRIVDYLYDKPFYKLSHLLKATKDGGVETFSDINEGDQLYLMHGSTELLVKRASRVVEAAKNENILNVPLMGGINIFCAGSMVLIKDKMDEVCRSLCIAYDGKPFICPFTYGEQGRLINEENVHGNLMAATALFYPSVIETK